MKFNEIKEIMELAYKYGFEYYKLQNDNAIIEIGKNHHREKSENKKVITSSSVVEKEALEVVTKNVDIKEEKPVEVQGHIIKAPIVGTYYSSPSPEKDDFVIIGSKVKKGDVLCIIEAMKIMNEIVADKDGEIVQIHCKNEDLVEFDLPLFTIG